MKFLILESKCVCRIRYSDSMKKKWEMPIITFDVDWAPDFIIEEIKEVLVDNKIKSTWFITNDFPILKELKNNSLFELGLHPNFEQSSTQGKNETEILTNLKKIIPKAKSIRTHKFFQSSIILDLFQKYGIENDSSILLPHVKNINPHYIKYFNLYRFPVFWEDDVEMANKDNWLINHNELDLPGMKIFNFHPIHIYLNSCDMKTYSLIKQDIGIEKMNHQNSKKFINNTKAGVRTFFDQLIDSLQSETYTIKDVQKIFKLNNDAF